MDGAFIPSAARLFFDEPWWRNLFDNPLTVQFVHRMVAYTLLALAVARHRRDAVAGRDAVVRRVVAGGGGHAAGVLGILTLINPVPIDLALAHQAVAIVVLTLAVMQAERLVAAGSSFGSETGYALGQPRK